MDVEQIFTAAWQSVIKNLDVALIIPNLVLAAILRTWLQNGEGAPGAPPTWRRHFQGDRFLTVVYLIGAFTSGAVSWSTLEGQHWWRNWFVGSTGAVMIYQSGRRFFPDWFLPGLFGHGPMTTVAERRERTKPDPQRPPPPARD